MKNEVHIHEVTSGVLKGRREFLKISGLAAAGSGLFLAGCSNQDEFLEGPLDVYNRQSAPGPVGQLPGIRNGVYDLGGNDLGVLTYAYALEQLEADFYTKVVNDSSFTSTFNNEEQEILVDLYNHEVIHREFFKAALTGASASPNRFLVLPDLEFKYGTLDFSNRTQVLTTAKVLEDTGVSAYNGAGKILSNPTYLLLAGEIVSVEARHASAIRNLLNPGSADFAGDDVVDPVTGLDLSNPPSAVIAAVSSTGFITTPFTAQFLP